MPRYAEFNEDARKLWRKVVAIMGDRLTISPDNAPLLELYCLAYSDYRAARRAIRANGAGGANKSRSEVVRCMVLSVRMTRMLRMG